jgi:hypothetical protein
MKRISIVLASDFCRHRRAAVNAAAKSCSTSRSVWTAVASAPLLTWTNSAWRLAYLAVFLAWLPVKASETNSIAEADAAYTRTIIQRADKIVAALNIADTNKFIRVRDIITQQYRDLSKVHEERDAYIKTAKETAKEHDRDKETVEPEIAYARAEAQYKLDRLHAAFLKALSPVLSLEQVDRVKDGMTYGVLPLTYGVYLRMYPDLTDEQKKQIMTWLFEARELAMDGSTSDEKHAVFGKYKGRINNYLSKAGYDAKKGEQNLKKPAAPPPPKLN